MISCGRSFRLVAMRIRLHKSRREVRYRTDTGVSPPHNPIVSISHGWFTVNIPLKRKRSAPHTLEEQISTYAARLRAEVASLPDGAQKSSLLKKIRQCEEASALNAWLAPSG
jgi:hypothetical protein